ncbi:S9 family peptidase [Pseudoalteromonas sp. G4]|uniref:S9 family peptidase n=1 Tax=Pseudoalteromonas sp. G4 TaxID=2992761 RepID=UPI00237E8B6D|nr:S9 family peptidase [Pseudoalteromonas sp. G4]MDE3273714.1 S9 family peptidase [Pseudoalteromonas sp. G4]
MKKIKSLALGLVAASVLAACSSADNTASSKEENLVAPIAKKVPFEMTQHGHTRVDNYYWMRDDKRQDPEILAHLEAENSYTEQQLKHTESLQSQLFDEIKGRIVKDDQSVPVKKGDYFYGSEVSGDNEYRIYTRAKDLAGTNKEVLLDVNELAKNHEYFSVSGLSASPDSKLLAYGEDTVSRRIYTIRIKNLETGEYLKDEIKDTEGDVVWGNNNQFFYYIKKDPQTLLGYQVYRHVLGTEQSQDELVYEEKNKAYYTYISKSKDGQLVYIHHSSTEASGVSILNANDVKATPTRFIPREAKHEYSIAKLNNDFYIKTNLNAVNFRLMKVDAANIGDKTKWQEVIPARDNVKLEDIELFNNHLVYQERENGLIRYIVRELNSGNETELKFKDVAFASSLSGNHELDNPKVRLYYASMTTPISVLEFSLESGDKTVLKEQKVLGDFNTDNYVSERIMVTARDGKKVPVSLVYRKDKFKKDGTNPLYQYGYGSYGATFDPIFSSSRLSLLDRGFVYAIAHIRGSEMLGRPWYDDGKKLTKKNTFNDFVDVTKSLVAQGYGAKDKVFAVGGSAGGLLMGAVINQAPELYRGVAAHVPFVDVVTTMLDESIPLTTNEYDEWGNPNDKVYYDYMLSYSPYDQVKRQAYPNLLVTTGLHDSQVQYFEPMKWVAKLREYKTDNNLLLFKTDMEAGHGGSSGRFKRINDTALEYAFFLDLLNK